MQSALLVLYRLVRYKYLREDHLMVKLWYDYPVVTRSHSGERAVSSTSGLATRGNLRLCNILLRVM